MPKPMILVAAAAIFVPSVAPAQQQQAPKPVTRAELVSSIDASFKAMDTNHDGYLSAAEVQAAQNKELQQIEAQARAKLEAQFRQLDTNKDGQLSLQEFLAIATVKANQTPQQLIGQLDTNHDGKISADEFKNPRLEAFSKLDTNHDGVISVEEQRAAAAAARH